MVDEIPATGGNYRPGRISRMRPASAKVDRTGEPTVEGDRVEISELAYWRAKIASLPEVRVEKIIAARAELAKNSYETPEKWAIAIERLVEDLTSEI